jgi:hypothetical protein
MVVEMRDTFPNTPQHRTVLYKVGIVCDFSLSINPPFEEK